MLPSITSLVARTHRARRSFVEARCATPRARMGSPATAATAWSWPLPVLRWYYRCVPVERLAVSFDPDLVAAVRTAAAEESISSWLADAARRKLRAEGLLAAIGDWEAEHGRITGQELRRARRRLRRR